jgi:hypothetical protein
MCGGANSAGSEIGPCVEVIVSGKGPSVIAIQTS